MYLYTNSETQEVLSQRQWPSGNLKGFAVISSKDRLQEAQFVYPWLPITLSKREREMKHNLFKIGSNVRGGLLVDQIIFSPHPNEGHVWSSYMILKSELLFNPYVMLCKRRATWRTRLTKTRNKMAELVAKRLHFIVPEGGIHGDVAVCKTNNFMTRNEAFTMLSRVWIVRLLWIQ